MKKFEIKSGSPIRWLIAANIVALIFFGGKYWYSSFRERQYQHKLVVTAASIVAETGAMSPTDSTILFDLSNDLEHGAKISDTQLDWCLNQIKRQEPSILLAASRRLHITNVLCEGVKSMDASQKEKLFQAMVAEFEMDNPKDEIGIDVIGPAHVLSRLGNKQAIPSLQLHLNDSRPRVHQVVTEAIKKIETTTAG